MHAVLDVSGAGEVRLGVPQIIFVCDLQFNVSHWFLFEQNQFALRDWPGLMKRVRYSRRSVLDGHLQHLDLAAVDCLILAAIIT